MAQRRGYRTSAITLDCFTLAKLVEESCELDHDAGNKYSGCLHDCGCDACIRLLQKWDTENIVYEERRVELSQATLDEARQYGKLVPIVVWPDGRARVGDSFGCFI